MHAQLGRFLSRDPIGYIAAKCVNLYEYVWDSPQNRNDFSGLQGWPDPYCGGPAGRFPRCLLSWEDRIRRDIADTGVCILDYDDAWQYFIGLCPAADQSHWYYFGSDPSYCRRVLSGGCVGITSCMIGRNLGTDVHTDFEHCFNTLARAREFRDVLNEQHFCSRNGQRNMFGGEARAVIFGYQWSETPLRPGETDRSECPNCGCIIWNDRRPERRHFNFGFYDERLNCFFNASTCESDGGSIICTPPTTFNADRRSTIYCVTCESADLLAD